MDAGPSPLPARSPAPDAITPELVLVLPDELAAVARLRLPERPWETGRERGPARAALLNSHPRSRVGLRAVGVAVVATLLVAVTLVGVVLGQLTTRTSGDGTVLGEPPALDAVRGESPTQPAPLLPRGGYVVSPSGSLTTDASGRMIELFTLPLSCGSRQLVLRDIPVSGRSLEFTGRVVGRPITVRVSGTVLDRTRVRGVVVAEGAACSGAPVSFFARLS